jgi:hypothetical protein
MSERFDDDMMEDLMAEAPEGSHAMDEFDEADEAEGFDEAEDSLEDLGDDELEESFDSYESEDGADEMEEAVTDALEADDADEFFGAFKKILKKAAPMIGNIAGMLPIPGAGLIGKAAGLIGDVMADEGDEMDALDSLADYADEEEGFDALAPAVAGLAIRGALKRKAAAIPRVHRRKLVKTVTAVTKHIAHRHGRRAVVAMPAIVEHARRIAVRRRLGAKHLPALVARTARIAVRSPKVLRKLVHASTRLRTAPGGVYRVGGHRGRLRRGGLGLGAGSGIGTAGGVSLRGGVGRSTRYGVGGGAAACPHCRRRSFSFGGPVTITIQSR